MGTLFKICFVWLVSLMAYDMAPMMFKHIYCQPPKRKRGVCCLCTRTNLIGYVGYTLVICIQRMSFKLLFYFY